MHPSDRLGLQAQRRRRACLAPASGTYLPCRSSRWDALQTSRFKYLDFESDEKEDKAARLRELLAATPPQELIDFTMALLDEMRKSPINCSCCSTPDSTRIDRFVAIEQPLYWATSS